MTSTNLWKPKPVITYLSRRKLLAIEIGMKCISSKLIIKPNQNTIPIFHPIVPTKSKLKSTIRVFLQQNITELFQNGIETVLT
jgi:hypothetical protein